MRDYYETAIQHARQQNQQILKKEIEIFNNHAHKVNQEGADREAKE